MIDDELTQQWREVTGRTVPVCSRCGRPVTGALLTDPQADPSPEAGVDGICRDCWERIEAGEVPLDLDDESELP